MAWHSRPQSSNLPGFSLKSEGEQRDCEHPRAKRWPERRRGRPETPKLETLASLPRSMLEDRERRCEDAGWRDTVPTVSPGTTGECVAVRGRGLPGCSSTGEEDGWESRCKRLTGTPTAPLCADAPAAQAAEEPASPAPLPASPALPRLAPGTPGKGFAAPRPTGHLWLGKHPKIQPCSHAKWTPHAPSPACPEPPPAPSASTEPQLFLLLLLLLSAPALSPARTYLPPPRHR